MTAARRGFRALVGGSLLSGTVQRRASAVAPTLILPPQLQQVPAEAARPLLEAEETQMHAILHIKGQVPDQVFRSWLEGGLQQARMWRGRDAATMDRIMAEAVERHGSFMAAIRAGAL